MCCFLHCFQVISFKKAILKYDIEGKEYAGLQHASKLFSQIDIPYVFMEWGVIKRDYRKVGGPKIPQFILSFFQSRGYQPYSNINGVGRLDSNYDAWPWDIIWFRSGKPNNLTSVSTTTKPNP